MEKVRLAFGEHGLRLEEYPGGANVVRLEGPPAARLSHLSLHRVDLQFAQQCLDLLSDVEDLHTVSTEAAWRSALLHYCKCFAPPQGGGGRTQLNATTILGPESGQLMKDHRLMMGLRNKHLVHDEGTHNWCAVGAVIAPVGSQRSVLHVNVAAMDTVSLDVESARKLRTLVERVLNWAKEEFERLAGDIGLMLQQTHTHQELLSKKALGLFYKSKGRR